jgi:hypothetical protein
VTSKRGSTLVSALLVVALLAACGDDGNDSPSGELPQGADRISLDPADFTTRIDNPYWPMRPGSHWVYRETGDEGGGVQRNDVTVTRKMRRIANGVRARVVHDVVSEDGHPVEVTDDWYAQDGAGNVWYLGERTAEYENGKVKTRAGSFEAGVDGAQAGIAMPAHPRPGLSYRQEYYAGEAEDRAEVLGLDEQADVPLRHFGSLLMTRETNPLEPRVLELKLYARGVGPVLAVSLSGGGGREELVSYRAGK